MMNISTNMHPFSSNSFQSIVFTLFYYQLHKSKPVLYLFEDDLIQLCSSIEKHSQVIDLHFPRQVTLEPEINPSLLDSYRVYSDSRKEEISEIFDGNFSFSTFGPFPSNHLENNFSDQTQRAEKRKQKQLTLASEHENDSGCPSAPRQKWK